MGVGGGGREDGWIEEVLYQIKTVRLRFTAASSKNGYSCYISFFTNFAFFTGHASSDLEENFTDHVT